VSALLLTKQEEAMPHELFGDVLVRPRSTRSHRSSIVVLSVVAHGVAIVALLIVPLLATDTLPIPQRALDLFIGSEIVPVVPPPPQRQHTNTQTNQPAAIAAPGAPTTAPNGVAPETGAETLGETIGSGGLPIGAVEGIDSGGIGVVDVPPPPPPQGPVRIHQGIRAPLKVVDIAPVYPAVARAARIEGVVIIEATIDARGNVEAARVLRPQPMLDQAALDAVKQWKFTPTLLNGVPVPVIMTVTVNFTLQNR
jgi:periplasmic protein TonB